MTTLIKLQTLTEADLQQLWRIGFTQTSPKWKQFAAPYFDDYQPYGSFQSFQESEYYQWALQPNVQGIFVNEFPIGIVSRYWECQNTRWLEIGIEIYDEHSWGQGYGTTALQNWITQTFADFPELEHIGLTTWSGNPGMMRTAEKLGMIKEAQIRKVRYWQDHYYDSVKYGILREDWLD